MPFNSGIELIFNCGFCRTAIFECRVKKPRAKASNEKETGESSTAPESQNAETPQSEEVSGETTESSKVCAEPDVAEYFRACFSGPQFTVGENYFVDVSTSAQSLFARHAERVRKAFSNGFQSTAHRNRYVQAFSSEKWAALSEAEKLGHSLSNCVACATQFEQLQAMFPLKPVFLCPSENENECVNIERVDAICYQATGKPFTELSANLGYKSASEVRQIVKQAEKKCVRDTQKKVVAECKKQLDDNALPGTYATDTSFSKYEKIRRAVFLLPPSEVHSSTKKRYPLRPDECDRHDELCEKLRNWDPAKTLVASELAREHNAVRSDSSNKIKLLARELNSSIPGSEIVPKPKSSRPKLSETSLSMPVPPNKKRLLAIDRSMVASGTLNEGLPCVPVKLNRIRDGVCVEITAYSRKFPLLDIRQSLLSAHEKFMRLHSDGEIERMSREDILSILQLGARYSMCQFEHATVEELKATLTHFERNRTIWVWHDHSSLASHGILAVMVGVVYDSLVFKSESEIGHNVQEYIEEGEVHIVAHGSSTLEDQATLIPERLAELEVMTDVVTSSSGIQIVDTVRFFKGDKPAAQFEAGVSCGGNYPCVGCSCHRNRFPDFSHAANCSQRSLPKIRELATAGHFGKVPGRITFYEGLSKDQLRMELEKRAVKDYPTDKDGRLATLKDILQGIHRVPSVLLLAPEATLAEIHLGSYCVLPCEPLHDLKGYLGAVLKKLPSVLHSSLKASVSQCLDALGKKSHLYGCDFRNALVQVAHIFAANSAVGPAADYVACLVQVSQILYSKDSNRSPKQCLQLYNCTFVLHQLHCELFGRSSVGLYFHALLIHSPVQHELVCSRSTNVESEERIFKSADSSAMCTDRKQEHMLIGTLKRMQSKRSSKTDNPLQSLHQSNSRIARSASRLPPYKGTVLTAVFIRTHEHAYQEHLKRIGHFLVQGEGVWWHKASDGSVCFHDGHDDPEFSHSGPDLLHFRNSNLEDVLIRSRACWQKANEQQMSLPVVVTHCHDGNCEVSRIDSTDESGVLNEPEVSSEESFMLPTLPPPESSTPVRQHVPEVALPEPMLGSEESDAVLEEMESTQEAGVVQPTHSEGCVDIGVLEVHADPHTSLQSSVCKTVARLIGLTDELEEFDRIRRVCKAKGNQALPVELERHRTFARHFRKLIYLHKRRLEHTFSQLAPSDAQYLQCEKDLKDCLRLIVSLQ